MPDQMEADVLEFDLDEEPDEPSGPFPREATSGGEPPGPALPRWRARLQAVWPRLAWCLVGVVVGGLAVHVVHVQAANRQASAVRVALGEFGARQLSRRIGTTRGVLLGAVAVNEGNRPLVITGLRAEGAQLRLSRTYPAVFPLRLEAGGTAEMPFVLRGDCAVGANEIPRITLLVGPPGEQARAVDVDIPDLDTVWKATLAPDACGPGT